jgi:ubiquinone/menaquinone biosynthesis C-methylase UbiE
VTTAAPASALDQGVKEAFRERLRDIHNGGALALAISLGHRLRLFDVMACLPPSTSGAVAEAAGLDERYVREWLSALTAGGVVAWDPATETFVLPPEHAGLLTRRASPENMAVSLQFVPLLAAVEGELAVRFRDGGGLRYEDYDRFHEVMAEMSSQTVVSALFDQVLPLVPDLPARLQQGIEVMDVGCGRGRALVALASAYPNSRFLGIDIAADAVAVGQARADALRLRNIRFEVRDAARLPAELRADLVTAFDAIHDQAEPEAVLEGIRRAVPDDGVFLMQEMSTSSHLEENQDHPLGAFLYTLSFAHCMSVSLARGGAGLGTCWGREHATDMLHAAGFKSVARHHLPHDPLNEFYVVRP